MKFSHSNEKNDEVKGDRGEEGGGLRVNSPEQWRAWLFNYLSNWKRRFMDVVKGQIRVVGVNEKKTEANLIKKLWIFLLR